MTAPLYRSLISESERLSAIEGLDAWDEATIDDSNIELATWVVNRVQPILDAISKIELSRVHVPVEWTAEFITSHMEDFQHLRRLYKTCRLAANVAAYQRDFVSVANHGMLILDLANATRRGGLVLDHLVALALAGSGISCLRIARTEFTDETRRDLIHSLERYEAEREPLSEIEQRDAKWEAACGQQGVDHSGDGEIPDEDLVDEDSDIPVTQQRSILQAISEFSRLRQAQKQTIHNEQELRGLAHSRLLTVDLALRCHYHRHSRFPGSLADLSPEFLTVMPDDPFTSARFIYRPHDASFMLYSSGPDQTDNGGNFGPWIYVAGGGYDLSLDGEDYQPTGRHALPGPSLLSRLWSRILQRHDH